jgi:uncharacterized protein YjiS (DUF1127 family)
MNTLVITRRAPSGLPVDDWLERSRLLLATWYRRARQRSQLAELGAQQLRDIGISREQAMAEAAKPFWRE